MIHSNQSPYDGDGGGDDDTNHNPPTFHHDDYEQHGRVIWLALLYLSYPFNLFGYDHENDYIHDHAHVRVDFHDHIHDYENDHKHYLLQYDLSENFLTQEVIISLCYHLNELNNNSLFILSDW